MTSFCVNVDYTLHTYNIRDLEMVMMVGIKWSENIGRINFAAVWWKSERESKNWIKDIIILSIDF